MQGRAVPLSAHFVQASLRPHRRSIVVVIGEEDVGLCSAAGMLRGSMTSMPTELSIPASTYEDKGEYIDILARRLAFSRFYTCFFISVIVAGIVEVLWVLSSDGGVGQLPKDTSFVVVETYVTVGLALELPVVLLGALLDLELLSNRLTP